MQVLGWKSILAPAFYGDIKEIYITVKRNLFWLCFLWERIQKYLVPLEKMASGPISSWQLKGKKVEVVTGILSLGSEITVILCRSPFSFCCQSFPASRSFPMSQLFAPAFTGTHFLVCHSGPHTCPFTPPCCRREILWHLLPLLDGDPSCISS